VHLGVEQVELLGRQLVDPVHVDRAGRVVLVDRQVLGPAVHLAGRGVDDGGLGAHGPDELEEGQLAPGVEIEVPDGLRHRGAVADLAGHVEHDVDALEHAGHDRVADVGREDAHVQPVEVAQVAAVLGDEAVDHADLGAAPHEGVHQVGADEAEPAGHQASRTTELGEGGVHDGHEQASGEASRVDGPAGDGPRGYVGKA
jgi:uncharacterized protein YidB (DUF937 family)